jgi:hypothetical protein
MDPTGITLTLRWEYYETSKICSMRNHCKACGDQMQNRAFGMVWADEVEALLPLPSGREVQRWVIHDTDECRERIRPVIAQWIIAHSPLTATAQESLAPPMLSEPMSEPMAIEFGRKGVWITCITPDKQRNRKWVRTL